MPSIINLTPQVLTLNVTSSATGSILRQTITDAIDISAYDVLDLQLGWLANTTGATWNVGITTGMQNSTEDNSWINYDGSLSTFNFTAGPYSTTYGWTSIRSFNSPGGIGLLRYVRWIMGVNAPGSAGVISFSVRGMARRYGGG